MILRFNLVELRGQGKTKNLLCFPLSHNKKNKNPCQNLPDGGILQVWNFVHSRHTLIHDKMPHNQLDLVSKQAEAEAQV